MSGAAIRVVTLGGDTIDSPIFGGEQRCYWLHQIYLRQASTGRVEATYLHDDRFMGAFRPAKRGFRSLLAPIEARLRRVPLSLIRQLGNRPGAAAALHERLADYRALVDRADLVQLEHPFAYPFFEDRLADKRVVYSSHNVESRILGDYFRRIQPGDAELRALQLRIERVENALARRADLVLACTERDADHYREVGARHVVVAANGAEPLPEIDDPERAAAPFERYALFISSAWNPNVAGLLRYCGDLALPDGHGLVCAGAIGGSTHPGMETLRRNSSIAFTGRTDAERIAALATGARLLIVPMLDAGGSNIKTAQALLTDKPLVATREAFRGYEAFSGSAGVTLCETPADFAGCIARGLAEPPVRVERPEAEALRWSRVLAPAEQAIGSLLETLR